MNNFLKKFIKKFLVYILVFAIVIYIIGCISTYFYENIKRQNSEVDALSNLTNLNLYFLKYTKTSGVKIKNFGLVDDDNSSYFITLENKDGTNNTFLKINDTIYFNKIKLCENVDEFKVIVDKSSKESISVNVKIDNKDYTMQYVIK